MGQVLKVNGGNVSKSITCHSLLFPYQVYYCHEIPNVRLYQVDIQDPETKVKINRAIAICHLDTSNWNPGHAAFMVLGSGPGLIEACH
ncbi:putative BURP domain-containing protein [Medicago truncatula]|uniref:Polygalacturonase non-catalytic protein n=1 Tax=Medicago truncatula TaxID=3880 RepID=G7LC53_MEDTR|nr:polygalacturonase non-catalytic protein [Medicago truncatula]RHN41987.1 putative BURP domain-containing protein [Medicago truncatula]